MRIQKKVNEILEGDLTPMIDMTFLLIAFFMLIINFSEVEKDQELELPDSRVARPPDEPPKHQIVLNLKMNEADTPRITFSTNVIDGIENLDVFLEPEIKAIGAAEKLPPEDIVVVIRADRDIGTGYVQKLIAKCQQSKLSKFALRAKEDIR